MWQAEADTELTLSALPARAVSQYKLTLVNLGQSTVYNYMQNSCDSEIPFKPTNMFMLNMAVADFLMLTVCSVLYVFKQTVVFTLYLPGPVFCYMSGYLLSKLFRVFIPSAN